jgi:hypothetical protein
VTSNHGLNSDGFTLAQFLPLWHTAMWQAVDPTERARLTLEMGRARIREQRVEDTTLIAFTPRRDSPFTVMPLDAVPTPETGELRTHIIRRLGELGATEVYLLFVQPAPTQDGPPAQVLISWCETVEAEAACWMQAFRYTEAGLQEAPPFFAPDAAATAVHGRVAGLLTPHH